MNKSATIVITPRDRYSNLVKCIEVLYANTDEALFDLIILNLGYPSKDWIPAMEVLGSKSNYRVFDYGRVIPMEAMDRVRQHIDTRFTVFLDNDSRVMPRWLPILIETAEVNQAAVTYPLILESSGVDSGADVRTHLFTTELRVVDVDTKPYLIEYKTYRRALPEDLPQSVTESQACEMHCVMFDTHVLKSLELPRMTIREHLDIGMQLRSRNLKLFVEPRSQVKFDNLGERAKLSDLIYFNLRWNKSITSASSLLFEKRWGFRFYSEQSIYSWASRRKLFLIMRWLFLPIAVANGIDRVLTGIKRRLFPVWDPLDDPVSQSRMFYDQFDDGIPKQLDHRLSE
jgi:hypothetical protein